MQFTPIIITIAGTPLTFGAESLTPQETHLRDMTSDKPYSSLKTAKISFSAPTQNRPSSFTMSRVYKSPIQNDAGLVVGVIRTDVKTTIPLIATPSDRAQHVAFVTGLEGNADVRNQEANLVSWY